MRHAHYSSFLESILTEGYSYVLLGTGKGSTFLRSYYLGRVFQEKIILRGEVEKNTTETGPILFRMS
jgi:hypothetical protein